MPRRNVVIIGAAGRDFHNFNTRYRDDESVNVVAFPRASRSLQKTTCPPSSRKATSMSAHSHTATSPITMSWQ